MAHIIDDAQNTTAPNIYKLLNEAKQKIGAVGKNEVNSAQKFNFRGIDAVINQVAPVFNELGIIVVPEVLEHIYETVSIGQRQTPMGHVTLAVKYTFYGPEGDNVSATVLAEAMDSGDKAAAKAMSVGMRIALLQTLNLPTDEPDPDSVSYERSGGQPAPVGRPVQPQPLLAPDDLVEAIQKASTVDELRVEWKAAGAAGHLQSDTVLKTGEKIKVQDLLYRRKDELDKRDKPGFPESA
jgi:hypothetical protein